MREVLDNIGSYAGKFGAGMLTVAKKGPTNDALSDEISTALANVGKRRHFLYNTNAIESVSWESPNLSEHGPQGMLESCYGMLAGGTGLPKTRWYGAQAGNLEGSRTNLKLEWGVISAIQASYEPIIRAIVEDLFPGQFKEYTVAWKLEAQMDDMEKAQLQKMRADSVTALAPVATKIELRKIAKLPDVMVGKTLSEEQQEAIKDLAQTTNPQGPSGAAEKRVTSSAESQPQKPTTPNRSDAVQSMQDGSFPAYVAYWEAMGYSRNGIITQSEIGRGTFYKYLKQSQEVRTSELNL
jgi:hypothetical protein